MVQFRGFIPLPIPLSVVLNPDKAMADGILKVPDLAGKVSDEKISKIVDAANMPRKLP